MYPIAEIFESIQGEGIWSGTPMTFIRLAGCCVGRPYTEDAKRALGLAVFQERCTDWAGNSFPCDTNYRGSRSQTPEEIVLEAGDAERVSITGGEPFMHNLYQLMVALRTANQDIKIHAETSGVRRIDPAVLTFIDHLVVSPKAGYRYDVMEEADEVKVLVGSGFDEHRFIKELAEWQRLWGKEQRPVWLSPVNKLTELDQENTARCISLVKKYAGLRICIQVHKVLGLR